MWLYIEVVKALDAECPFIHTGEVIAFIENPGSLFLYLNAEISNIYVTVGQEDCW